MKFSIQDNEDLTLAKSMSCDVLLAAVTYQADNNMLSEAHCEAMATAYKQAAAYAKMRRESAPRVNGSRAIFSGNPVPLRQFTER